MLQGAAPGPVDAPAPTPGGYPGTPSGVYTGTPSHAVLIDGRPLPVMRRADGGYLSTVQHESFLTLLAAARAAVDDVRGARPASGELMLHHA